METSNETEIKYYCEACNYKCLYQAHWKQHLECDKHKNNCGDDDEEICFRVGNPKCRKHYYTYEHECEIDSDCESVEHNCHKSRKCKHSTYKNYNGNHITF